MDSQLVLNNIRKEFKEYITKTKLKSVILGISGGMDSALVAAIVKPVCDDIGVKLIGISLPSASNKKLEVDRADMIMYHFCTESQTIKINDYVQTFRSNLLPTTLVSKEQKISFGNMKARTRMMILYHIAYENSGMVLGTDNLTELNLGFWTLHGDVGDYSMIQYLWKSEVYELSQWIVDNELLMRQEAAQALIRCIEAVPTDGLGITNSDLDQIGVKTYAEVDTIFKEYFAEGKHKDSPVIQRHLRTQFKRDNPHIITRETLGFPLTYTVKF